LDGLNESNPFVGLNNQDHAYCKYLTKYHYFRYGSKGKQYPTLNESFRIKVWTSQLVHHSAILHRSWITAAGRTKLRVPK
jgi:hypothetical protein